jgi:type IV secretory pathway TraG/TraD family ATPase VirD4
MSKTSEHESFVHQAFQPFKLKHLPKTPIEPPDIIFCAKALGASNLPARVQNAHLPTWVETSFGQLISMADSEKTVASVISTASILFSRFMSPDILSVFCGKTTIPLELKGKQLLIIGMKREKQDVVAPLLATVLHMIVTRNTKTQRRGNR